RSNGPATYIQYDSAVLGRRAALTTAIRALATGFTAHPDPRSLGLRARYALQAASRGRRGPPRASREGIPRRRAHDRHAPGASPRPGHAPRERALAARRGAAGRRPRRPAARGGDD